MMLNLGTADGTPAPAGPPPSPSTEVLRLATAYQASRALHVALRLDLPAPPSTDSAPRIRELPRQAALSIRRA
jgi:hypothetical protein